MYCSDPRQSPAKSRVLLRIWTAEEQNVAVRVANLETAQTIVRILKRSAELCAAPGKFGSECIGIRCIDKGVPPHVGVTLVVWQGRHIFVGLDEELRSIAADDGEKRIPDRAPGT